MVARILCASLALACFPLFAHAEVDEVLIGYFGPSDPSDPQGGDMWRAAQLALEEANRQGGYRGKDFRLVPGWSKDPWGTGVVEVTRMAYRDRVWAIVGGIDGPSTHLAEQVVAKAHLVLISPVSTDKTVNLANVPWMFSCQPDDARLAAALAEAMASRVGKECFVLVSADDHDSRLFTVELRKSLARHAMVPRYQFECRRDAEEVAELAAKVAKIGSAAVVLVAEAKQSARLATAIRRSGFQGMTFGGPAMGRSLFLQQAGEAAEGITFPLLYECSEGSHAFAKTFQARFGTPPDYAAAGTFDAVRLLVAAVRKAGLDRARIREAVTNLSPWPGVTGTITWDRWGRNTRAVALGTIKDGRVMPVAAPCTPGGSTPRSAPE